jgi:hypothetical protein
MINVEFNSEMNGVTQVNCHHVTMPHPNVVLHFTKYITWNVLASDIKSIQEYAGTPLGFALQLCN